MSKSSTKASRAGASPAPAPATAPSVASAPAVAPATAPVTVTDAAGAATEAGAPKHETDVLIGSSVLPAPILIGGQEVQLGTVVAGAHAASGLTVAAWNELVGDEREKMLAEYVAAQVVAAEEALAAEQEQARATDAKREAKARIDAAAEAAERAAAVRREAEAETRRAEAALYPCVVEVGNNSGIALTEPVSGAHIQAGGSGRITLLSAEHAHQVEENLLAMLELNYLGPEVLVITKLPK